MNGQTKGWRFIEAAAGMLAPLDREAVLGDLAEMDNGTWRGLGDVLSLAARRQFALWRSWRPWAASLGLALPASLFLMGWSVAATGTAASLLAGPPQARLIWLSVSRLFLVISWAWMVGLVVGALSRGALWASVLTCGGTCLHCLSLWPGHGLSCLRLLIFVLPRTLGSVARPPRAEAWLGRGVVCSFHRHACISCFRQGRMDVRVQSVVAGMVPCCDGEAATRVNSEN
jgi:hypothetical protein